MSLSPSSIHWYRTDQRTVMLCGWEGNRRSGVALAMRHRLSGISTYGINGLGKGDEHHAYAALEYYDIFTFTSSSHLLIIMMMMMMMITTTTMQVIRTRSLYMASVAVGAVCEGLGTSAGQSLHLR